MIRHISKVLHKRKTLFELNCGMHTGHIDEISHRFGDDDLAYSGVGIRGHRVGARSGAMSKSQSITPSQSEWTYCFD